MRMCTQNVTTPTIILNFREENFRDQKSNHEIHENIVQRKFGAIRYPVRTLHNLQIYFLCISIAISYIMTRFHRASDFSQRIRTVAIAYVASTIDVTSKIVMHTLVVCMRTMGMHE